MIVLKIKLWAYNFFLLFLITTLSLLVANWMKVLQNKKPTELGVII